MKLLHTTNKHVQPPNPVGEPFDCTVQAGADHGLPIMIIDRGDVSTPSPHAYEAANASMPFGKDYDAYWLLEVHYNNPTNKAGLRDATGLVITYSPTLRQHDVGVLVLGAPPHVPQIGFVSPLIIPGGQPSFDYMNYCPGACTRRRFQQQQQQQHSNTTDEFHILYAHIHMHGLGRGGELQLIRNASGAADGWHRTRLLHRKHWDFEHQNGVAFAPPGLPLRPGDSFLTRCHYDSSGKNVTTIYGQSASDEVWCLVWLSWVQALDVNGILTTITPSIHNTDVFGAAVRPGARHLGRLRGLGRYKCYVVSFPTVVHIHHSNPKPKPNT